MQGPEGDHSDSAKRLMLDLSFLYTLLSMSFHLHSLII